MNAVANANDTILSKLSQEEFDKIMEEHDRYRLTKENVLKPVLGKRATFRGYDLSDINMEKRNLSDVDFSYSDISNLNFFKANLHGADLSNAIADGANFSYANLFAAKLQNVSAIGANFSHANLSYADAPNADFSRSDFSNSFAPYFHAVSASFEQANLMNSKFHNCIFEHATFENANAKFSELDESRMSNADFSRANLAQSSLYGSDFSKANLSEATLHLADCSYANLNRAKMTSAYLCGAIFRGNRMEQPPLSIGPLSMQNDFITYNPQDDSVSLDPEAHALPVSKEDAAQLPTSYNRKKYRPIVMKEAQKIARRDVMLQATLHAVETYKKEKTHER